MTTLLPRAQMDVSTSRDRQGPSRRAFSLIEVLLAIFILGVGVISIAALFPAGIAQQRASVDDVFGPTIANNALSLLRMKLRPEDFGTFEQFNERSPLATIAGDFTWLRPAFIFNDDAGTPLLNEAGAINIFSAGTYDGTEFDGGYGASAPTLFGIPYNRGLYGTPPRILISQTERYYPSATQNGTGGVGRPQYVWDCMFRRFQGKVLVAIFVYRVTQPGGGNAAYVVAPNPDNHLPGPGTQFPPLPIRLDLTDAGSTQANSCVNGPWHPGGPDRDVTTNDPSAPPPLQENALVLGTPGNTQYNPDLPTVSWQEPRQWILDQNNNVHRVLGVEMVDDDSDGLLDQDAEIELVRPVPAMANIGVNYFFTSAPNVVNPVTHIWYMPIAVRDVNGSLLNLTPVYLTVKEL